MKDKVLIVEDELIVARDLRKTLERNGFKVIGVARTFEKALTLIEEFNPTLVLLDIFLKGDLTGIDLARHLNTKEIPFIYISANYHQQVLEAANTTRPYGFIVKPFREKDLLVTIDIAKCRYETNKKLSAVNPGVTSNETRRPFQGLESKPPVSIKHQSSFCQNIVGRSAPMLHVFNLIQQVAPFDSSVLILGESGTGKEAIANCIVQQSTRKNKPFVKINCAAIPAELMEAELFGYEKGAFTGATERRAGKFELAAGGSILLDEIGEIRPEMQAKLLRVLQEKEIQRIGSSSVMKSDVRILAATSRVLEKEVAEGRFRLDLYYRLLVFPITMPPLRERIEDIPLLVDHFMRYYSAKTGKTVVPVSADEMQKLLHYDWPGNVRELQHLVERNVLLSNEEMSGDILRSLASPDLQPEEKKDTRMKTMEEMERDYIIAVLNQSNFRIAGKGGAAEILGLPPTTLHSKIKKLGIKKFYE
ncbi:MAG TPA: sigma-54 dependent transcriptional regulator [Chitinophagaceae bacterium]|nr:sigma-54 dependent transcriptional regulator [Chitinophagaceae bacterium]